MELLKQKREQAILFLYIVGFVCMAAALAYFQPLDDMPPTYANPPDEHARFLIPWYICQTGRTPTGFEEEVRIPGYGFSYVLYNAFPYIVQGFIMRIGYYFTDSKRILLYVGRSVNVVFGVVMALVIYRLSKRLFHDIRFQWLFCFGVMYWPEVIFVHSYVNTDSMCLLSTAIIVYALVCGYQEGFRRKDNMILSIGIILCALSYYNAYGYILVSIILFVAYFIQWSERRLNWQEMLKKGSFISVLVLLGISWWFIRCGILYDGDILGLQTRYNMEVQYAVDEVNPLNAVTYYASGKTLWEMLVSNRFLVSVLNSFIAVFGSLSIWGNVWIYRLMKGLFLVGFIGCIWQMCSPDGDRLLAGEERWKQKIFHVGMLACISIPWILVISYSYFKDYQAQGRYVLIMIVPFIYYMMRGLQRLSRIKVPLGICKKAGRNKVIWIPVWLQNVGIASVGGLIVGSSFYMIFIRTLPLCLEIGDIFRH